MAGEVEQPGLERNREARDQEVEETATATAPMDEAVAELSSGHGSKTEKVASAQKEGEKPKPSKLKEWFGKLGLDMGTGTYSA